MSLVLWFAGLIGLIVAAAVASSRGRAAPSEVVGRGVVGVAALVYAALVASAIWLWGGSEARDGRADRLREGATVAVTIDGVRLATPDARAQTITIGHGDASTVRVPGDGGDLLRVELDGRGHAVARVAGDAVTWIDAVLGEPSDRVGEGPSARAPEAAPRRTKAKRKPDAAAKPEANGNTANRKSKAGAKPDGRRDAGADAPESSGAKAKPDSSASGPAKPNAVGDRKQTGDSTSNGDTGASAPGQGDASKQTGAGRNGAGREVRAVGPVRLIAATADPLKTPITRACAEGSPVAFDLPVSTAVVAVECDRERERGALLVRRERDALIVTPLTIARGKLAPERRTLRAGDALRIGGGSDAIPNLVTWDVPAPNGAASMLAIPLDPTDCAAWSEDKGAARELASSMDEDRRATRNADGCLVRAGAFEVSAIPFVPNAEAVLDRAVWAALLIGAPVLVLLLVIAGSARRGRNVRALGRALRLAVLGVGLVALAGWRLLWAHRIDASDPAARVDANLLAVIAIGAVIAGNAVLSLDALDGRTAIRRAAFALLGWAAWLAGSVLITGLEPPLTRTGIGVLVLSAVAAIAPVLGEGVRRLRVPPELALFGIAAVAVIAKSIGARGALVKLGLAYATVLLGHAALRELLALRVARAAEAPAAEAESDRSGSESEVELPEARWRTTLRQIVVAPSGAGRVLVRGVLLLAGLGAAVGALASLDAGVTLAIVGVGLALAMLVAGHDAIYDAGHAGKLGVLEREHARLLAAHGVAVAGLAIAVAIAAILASDRELLESGAVAMLHAPLVAAGLFGIAALIARTHRRSWAPWLAAALAALAAWGMRDAIIERATAGDNVAARRVAAVVEPGYALLRDDHAFVANASAWKEASAQSVSAWRGQGYFGAAIRDPGVARSIDNDYLAVLVVRETGVGGLLQGVLLLLALVIGAGAIASVRLPHASRDQRARWLVTGVAGVLAVYQPLAALGILPLTGLTWPGLGIDSPGDLWLFVIGAVWCLQGAEPTLARRELRTDERVRRTPRLARARQIVLVAFVACGIASVVLVVRAGVCALSRAGDDDERVTAALAYASSLACAAPDGDVPLEEAIPPVVAGKPTDGATARYQRELLATWRTERAALLQALGKDTSRSGTLGSRLDGDPEVPAGADLDGSRSRSDVATPPDVWLDATPESSDPDHDASSSVTGRVLQLLGVSRRPEPLPCPARASGWRLEREGEACNATLSIGWPDVKLTLRRGDEGVRAACAIALPDDAVSTLRTKARVTRPRIRVVAAPIGASASDVGELVLGQRIVRLRAGAPVIDLATAAAGVSIASAIKIGETTLAVRENPGGIGLAGDAELFVAEAERGAAWRRLVHGKEVLLDRVTLIVAGAPERRVVALFRPARVWSTGAPVVDSLLADVAGDRVHRIYPHGAAIPELGWVNPFDVERSLGLDGWVHAYNAEAEHGAASCGTLAPPAIAPEQTCTNNPLDGVLECRVALQPQLVRELRALAERILDDPKPLTGRDVTPVRVGFVALRGDTGEILAQGNLAAGRPPLAYAPADARAEAELARLRDEPGEAAAERVEWNLPIAVGSTFKPILARAAEQAFPKELGELSLTAAGSADGCRRRRGTAVSPIAGHCPPTSVAGNPTTSDVHDFLAQSPNWFQAALGLIGLALPDAKLTVKDQSVTFADVVGSDLATWPADSALTIADAQGTILSKRGVTIAGLRRAPMWNRVEALLGRPMCTLGDRASCEKAAARADVCAARALPIKSPGGDLRNLIALGPDRITPYAGNTPNQTTVPVREYLQILRGAGVHPLGSLPQITDAFGRVIYDASDQPVLAASWFPAPAVGKVPAWSCAASTGRANTVLGADGGLCAVVRPGGTAHAGVKALLTDDQVVIYGAKTGTIDSLADIARSPRACARWNATHVGSARLDCGRAPPDDSLFVIAFGVVTAKGTIPITLGIQLQRAGKSAATRAAPAFVQTIVRYLRG
jgi:hypothetical protein